MMISFRIGTLVAVIILSLCMVSSPIWAADGGHSARETIRIGIFSLAPFMMTTANGEPGGVSVDFWREYLGPRLDVDIEVVGPYPIPRLEIMLELGEIDVIPYITRIPDRENRFLFPENPLSTISSCIIVRRDSPLVSIGSQKDLFGMKIGFITNAYIPPFVRHEKIELELVTTTEFREINHRKLMNARVDALLDINHVSLVYEMMVKGYLKDIRIIPLEHDRVSIYSIFNTSLRGKKLREKYDKVLPTLPDSAFDGITKRYLDKAN